MDLLYQPSEKANYKHLTVALGTSDPDRWVFTKFFDEFSLTSAQDSECLTPAQEDKLSIPHSGSFIDMDGDCMPDLVLTRVDEKSG